MARAKFFCSIREKGMYNLSKARRIQKNKEFRLIYRHAKFEVNRFCVVYKMPVAKEATKVGFVTGKKVGCAVERNRARRLMKEVYRLHQYEIREGYRIVIVARAGIEGASYQEVETELMKLLKRAKLLKEAQRE